LTPKELKKILDAARAGARGQSGTPAPPQQAQAPQVAQTPSEQPPVQQQTPPDPNPPASQIAQVSPPPVPRPTQQPTFGGSRSASSAVEEAAKAVAANRGGYGGRRRRPLGRTSVKAVPRRWGSSTCCPIPWALDFGPYLARVVQNVRANWYNIIPEVARPPIMKKGKLSIEFAILKDGKVAGMKLATGSGDVALDRAAWAAFTASNPLPPLPQEFGGPVPVLRFTSFTTPDSADLK